MTPLFIPSPPVNGFSIGPLTIRFYALCLIAGIALAWWLGERRWRERGGNAEKFETAVFWAIPVGIVGARLYHVLTHLGDYFGPGINPWSVFFIWEGGIAIFGSIAGGALGALIGCRREGIRFSSLADCLAPGIALGQFVGRFGNWFNQELYGWPTTLPWAVEISPEHRLPGFEQYATFQPTFAYEAVWDLLCAGILLWADRRFRLGRGKVFALYMALYGFGRFFTEGIRIDYSYSVFGPIRFNQFIAGCICLAGLALLIWLVRARPGREDSVLLHPVPTAEAAADNAETAETPAAETAAAETPADETAAVETETGKTEAETAGTGAEIEPQYVPGKIDGDFVRTTDDDADTTGDDS